MTSSDLWDDATARRYDEASADMFAPHVLDPAVETAVWEPRSLLPESRADHAMSYDAKRDRVVVFGGNGGGSGGARADT